MLNNLLNALEVAGNDTDIYIVVVTTFSAVATLFLTVISIILTYKFGSFQNKFNTISLRPIPRVLSGNFVNGLFVKLENRGAGPLYINNIVFCDDSNSSANIIELMPDIKNKYNKYWNSYRSGIKDSAISAGQNIVLLDISYDEILDKAMDNEIKEQLSKINVTLKYSDILGKEYSFKVKLNAFSKDNAVIARR